MYNYVDTYCTSLRYYITPTAINPTIRQVDEPMRLNMQRPRIPKAKLWPTKTLGQVQPIRLRPPMPLMPMMPIKTMKPMMMPPRPTMPTRPMRLIPSMMPTKLTRPRRPRRPMKLIGSLQLIRPTRPMKSIRPLQQMVGSTRLMMLALARPVWPARPM